MAKILISGVANSGKTSLLQTLTDVLVIANDGKKYPFKQPHVNVEEFKTSNEFISTVADAMEKYNEKFGEYPKTVVIDSLSKVVQDIEAHYQATVTSFPYNKIGNDIKEVMSFIENELVKEGFNVIFVSHAIKDDDGDFKLVTAGGSTGRRGGAIADVDYAIYVEYRNNKRVIHHKGKQLARNLLEDIPDKEQVADFSLQKYLETITSTETEVDEWVL